MFSCLKSIALITIVVIMVVGCTKNPDVDPGNNDNIDIDYTPVLPGENVTTDIMGYVSNDKNPAIPPDGPNAFYILKEANPITVPPAYFLSSNGTFSTGLVNTDKTMTWSVVHPGGGWNYLVTQKTFAVSSAMKNYTRIKLLNRTSIGTVTNVTGGSYNFGNSGQITYGSNTFYETSTRLYPGFFGPDIRSKIYITYHNPEHKDFAQRLPCYLAADDGTQRWFLKSYGAISMEMIAENWVNNTHVDFYSGRTADLKLPIPPSMQADAPDSIITWKLIDGRWVRGGKAIKQDNYYLAKIDKSTAWNFAMPVKGVYLNVNIRTDTSASITNTAVRIKTGQHIIAESMTDADGNAICFVPSNTAMIAEVLPDEKVFSEDVYSYPIPPLTKAGNVSFSLPGTIYHLSTLSGKVVNCNNEPIRNGMVKLSLFGDRQYYLPVTNGKLGSSVWLYGSGTQATAEVTDFSNSSQGEAVNLIFISGIRQQINFYNCANSTKLYCNYTVDNSSYELNDEASLSSVYMTISKASQYAQPLLKTDNANKLGVNFSVWPNAYGMYSVVFSDIMVNGVSYQFDRSKEATVAYSRFDPAANGYVEGWFSFNYFDNSNKSHHVEGNFRLKKTF